MTCKRLLARLRRTNGVGITLTLGAVISLVGCAKKEESAALPPEVEVTRVTQQDVPLYTECIATLDGYVNAQIQPQVSGYLMKQKYT
jgi:membrane fusion protein (multidrug efflux system)